MSDTHATQADVKEAVRQHWGRRATTFDERPNHGLHSEEQRRAWLALLRDLTGSAPLRVLDAGCGTGFFSLLLTEIGHQVTGIDLAPEMLALAAQKAVDAGLAIELRLGDVEALPDPDDTYDLLVARHLIWTLPDPRRAVREWRRVLRPGGRIALFEGHAGTQGQEMHAEYAPIHGQLPFYGGIPGERLADFLRTEGLREVDVRPLMEAALWGGEPQRSRHLVTGRTDGGTDRRM